MKFTVPCDELYRQVQACQRVIGGTTISPILTNVFIRAEKDGLSLIATDLELFYQCRVPATVEEEGAIMVPAKTLGDVLGPLAADGLSTAEVATTAEFLVEIKVGRDEFSLFGSAPEDFPSLPEIVELHAFSIPASAFRDMLGKTLYAVSVDESKPDIRGVLVQGDGTTLRMVATDGRRLAMAEVAVRAGFEKFDDVIVPSKVLQELARVAGDKDPIALKVGKTQIVFEVGGVRYTSRLVEGKFPNWRNLLPTERACRITVDTVQFLRNLKKINPIAREISFTIRCRFEKDRLEISALSSKIGKGRVELPVENDGEPITISYNAKYLQDCLGTVQAEKTLLEPVSAVKATRIGPATEPEGERHVNILMPIRAGV